MKVSLLKVFLMGILLLVTKCCKFTIYFDIENDGYVMVQAYTAGGVFLVSQDVISNKKIGESATLGGLGNVWYDIKFIDQDNQKIGAGDGWYCVGGERKLFYSDLRKYIQGIEAIQEESESFLRTLE